VIVTGSVPNCHWQCANKIRGSKIPCTADDLKVFLCVAGHLRLHSKVLGKFQSNRASACLDYKFPCKCFGASEPASQQRPYLVQFVLTRLQQNVREASTSGMRRDETVVSRCSFSHLHNSIRPSSIRNSSLRVSSSIIMDKPRSSEITASLH